MEEYGGILSTLDMVRSARSNDCVSEFQSLLLSTFSLSSIANCFLCNGIMPLPLSDFQDTQDPLKRDHFSCISGVFQHTLASRFPFAVMASKPGYLSGRK